MQFDVALSLFQAPVIRCKFGVLTALELPSDFSRRNERTRVRGWVHAGVRSVTFNPLVYSPIVLCAKSSLRS